MTLIYPPMVIGIPFPNGVAYDNSSYLSRTTDLTGLADSKVGTLSVWVRQNAGQDGVLGILYEHGADAADRRFTLQKTTSDLIQLAAIQSGGRNSVTMTSSVTMDDHAWHHILCAWDAATAASCLLYIDGVDDTATLTRTNATIDYTRGEHCVGARYNGTFTWDGDMAELWFDPTQALDLTDSAVVAKFLRSDGKPASLGATGQKPTGSSPILYLKGGAARWGTNYGTGGDVAIVTGSFSDSATKPRL